MSDKGIQTPLSASGQGREAERDPREERLRALYAQAQSQLQPSDALRERVAGICRRSGTAEEMAPEPQRRPRARMSRGWIPRWGWAVAIVVAVSVFSVTLRSRESAVEAAIRASAAAPAMHEVMRKKGESIEVWFVAGVGVRLEAKRPDYELVDVDDMKRRYRYERLQGSVEITPSVLARIGGMTFNSGIQSGTGALQELVGFFGPRGITVETIVRNGRSLKLLSGPNRGTRITIDPETDRILLIETGPVPTDGTGEVVRHVFDYPDPATVDRRLFRFAIPEGVTVVDKTAKE